MCRQPIPTLYSLYAFVVIMVLSGCSASGFPRYDAQPPDQYSQHIEEDGLSLAVQPITQDTEIEKYFGDDLLARGVIPILVVAHNRNSSASFILEKDKIKLKKGWSSVDPALGGDTAADEVMEMTGAVLFGVLTPVLIFGSASMQSQQEEVKRNLALKELRSTTLSPGRGTHGFVYFQFPLDKNDGKGSSNLWTIQIEAMNTNTKERHKLDYPLTIDLGGTHDE